MLECAGPGRGRGVSAAEEAALRALNTYRLSSRQMAALSKWAQNPRDKGKKLDFDQAKK